MRVGITRSQAGVSDGGIFQYEQAFLAALGEISALSVNELVYLSSGRNDFVTLAGSGGLSYKGLPVRHIARPRLPETASPDSEMPQEIKADMLDPDRIFYDRAGAERVKQDGIDLVLQLSPVANAFSLGIPFICPIFDLNHKLQPEFPEVSHNGEIQRREYFYINTCRYATFVLADSEVGRDNILQFYNDYIDADRIRVLPYYPPITRRPLASGADRQQVIDSYPLPPRYFFYPAQFWPHKNHGLIIQALDLIRRDGREIPHVVLCGSHADQYRARRYRELKEMIEQLGLSAHITFLGSVPEVDMPALYAMSAGLVMPTFFGPTNIPPLEAWFYGRPVISSDIPGIREQIGDAGLLVDPRSPAALAEAMTRIWTEDAVGQVLVDAGRRRLTTLSWESFVGGVETIVREACERVAVGQTPAYPPVPIRERTR